MIRVTVMPRCLTDTVKEPYSGFILSNIGLRVDNRCMSSWPALGTGMHHLVCAFTFDCVCFILFICVCAVVLVMCLRALWIFYLCCVVVLIMYLRMMFMDKKLLM